MTPTARPPADPQRKPVEVATLDALISGAFADPHSVLGPHLHDGAVTVRVLRPMAEKVVLVVGDQRFDAEHEHAGVFVAVLPFEQVPDYRVDVT